mmetsp:Transcript_49634/g.126138  ORF Transcript_49634/g.126138 Transcript_49634/m.126138 type:complete len:235 (-) Transcript_49634:263-967(-)|eukprot:CAMPEP_0183404384 /NCGR_PEP_ID=MMETSP0370-20130417/15128_1 /TAXON_ID=268820 /ORGANISM="Peridinium aciculiferum, Strain PAER-2" /LENGTH=234 /DNA_ID=CAMNT_0025586225 /DNA_START=105 /DNA_END=809 /DNA_ORIENTATION=+
MPSSRTLKQGPNLPRATTSSAARGTATEAHAAASAAAAVADVGPRAPLSLYARDSGRLVTGFFELELQRDLLVLPIGSASCYQFCKLAEQFLSFLARHAKALLQCTEVLTGSKLSLGFRLKWGRPPPHNSLTAQAIVAHAVRGQAHGSSWNAGPAVAAICVKHQLLLLFSPEFHTHGLPGDQRLHAATISSWCNKQGASWQVESQRVSACIAHPDCKRTISETRGLGVQSERAT